MTPYKDPVREFEPFLQGNKKTLNVSFSFNLNRLNVFFSMVKYE